MSLKKWVRNIVVVAAAYGGLAGSASAQLLDPSFENVCTWAPFEAWTPIGGNQFQTNSFAHGGVRAAFMYGNFFPGASPENPTGLNNVGFQQTVALPPGSVGQTLTASAWILNRSDDPLGVNVNGFVVVDFLDGATQIGASITSALFGNGTNPYDLYVQLTAAGEVPAGASSARMTVILQQQLDFTSDVNGVYRGGSVRYDDASLAVGAGANLLVNAGFENICAKPFFDWESFGAADHVGVTDVRTGTHSVKAYGPFFFPGNEGGFYQDLPATPGSQWIGSIHYLSRADDQINAAIDARVRIEFLDAVNVATSPVNAFQSADIAQGPATPTVWTLASTPLAVAPAGTAKVRLVVIHAVPNYQGGAIYYDDASLIQVTGNCCVGSVCSLTNAANCGGTFTLGGTCEPNPCSAPATGACCCGSSCSITTSAACTAINTAFVAGGVCTPYSTTVPCCRGNFNKSAPGAGAPGGISVQDIFDFLTAYFSSDPCANSNDSVPGPGAPNGISVQDIFDFLGAYFAGC